MDASASEQADNPRSARLTVTVRPETFARLQEARNEKGWQLNVSEIVDAAINAEIAARDRRLAAVARLRVESDRRRGARFRQGFQEGQRWAEQVGSWAEICALATLTEADVRIDDIEWTRRSDGSVIGSRPGFNGAFRPPEEDYGKWKLRVNRTETLGAPAFIDPDLNYGDPDPDDETVWVRDKYECDQYWRGWLSGVREVFELVEPDLDPMAQSQKRSGDGGRDNGEFIADPDDSPAVDPDEIPF